VATPDLFIKNPHSILPALESRPQDVLEIVFPRDRSDGTWKEIESLALKNKVRTKEMQSSSGGNDRDRKKFGVNDRGGPVGGRESAHGALIRAKESISIEQSLKGINANSRGVWLALDCLQDPQNLGAIFRSAAFFGIRGMIMTTERSAPMTSTVYDIASGGVESIPYVAAINLQRAFEKAKEAGLWILGTSEHSKESLFQTKNDRPWLLVVGNEEKGIRRLTEESCDMMCSIPARSKVVTSLNVSVATGILLGHLTRPA